MPANNYIIKILKYLTLILILGLKIEAQNWLVPSGGFKQDTTVGPNSYMPPRLIVDTANNNLFAITQNYLGPNIQQTVLHNGKWEKWYPNTFDPDSYIIPYKNKTNIFFKNYYEDAAQTKYRTAVLRFSNANDLDTMFKIVGHWLGGNLVYWQGKYLITVAANGGQITNYGSLAEITDTGLVKINDPRWAFLNNKLGRATVYKNNLYFLWQGDGGGGDGDGSIAVLKPDKWEIVPPGIYGSYYSFTNLLEYNKRLYAVGGYWKFERQTNPGNCVAAWDGEKWDSLGGGASNMYIPINAGFYNSVVCGGKLFLCGLFTHISGMRASKIVSWNDTTWCTLGGDLDSLYGPVRFIACLQDTLYAQGDFSNVKGEDLGPIAKLVNINHVDSCGRPRYKIMYVPTENFDFKYYPNPLTDKLTIEFLKDRFDVERISIINSLGQVVYQMDNPNSKQQIDLSFLPGAVYYLRLEGNFLRKIFKLVKV